MTATNHKELRSDNPARRFVFSFFLSLVCQCAHSGETFTIDKTFNPGTIDYPRQYGFGFSLKIVLQPDQKIILCGPITNVDGRITDGMVRLNTDGSLDSSFQPA